MITVGAAVSLILNSPIDNVNRALGREEHHHYKKITTVLVLIFVFTTKKGQKMSFHARWVEIVAKIGIMEIAIDFTEQ